MFPVAPPAPAALRPPMPVISEADPTQERTGEAARRALTPRVEARPKQLPIATLNQAIRALDFKTIAQILPRELAPQFIETKAKMLFGQPTPDHLTQMLLYLAIEQSYLELLPALPPLTHRDEARLAELAQFAGDRFSTNMNSDTAALLHAFTKQYRPQNGAHCIREAYQKASAAQDRIQTQFLLRSFPEYQPEAPTQRDNSFPHFLFQMALVNLSSVPLSAILLQHGWEATDLDIIQEYAERLLSEQKRYGNQESVISALSSVDEITYRLIFEGIMNRRESLREILPLIPPFSSVEGARHTQTLFKTAAERLAAAPDDPFYLDIFIAVGQKYRPANLQEMIGGLRLSEAARQRVLAAF